MSRSDRKFHTRFGYVGISGDVLEAMFNKFRQRSAARNKRKAARK